MYMGKPAVLDEISKSRDQLEEMEKYVVPDETGILYETRWSFVERDYQEMPWKTYPAEMERSDSLAAVREKLQEYLKKREKSGGLRKDFTSRFFEEMKAISFSDRFLTLKSMKRNGERRFSLW